MINLPNNWSAALLKELASKVGSGATPRGGGESYKLSGTPLIRSMNVIMFGFKREGLAFIDEEQSQALQNVEVHAKDVLLNITGASIGRVTLAPEDLHGARVNQHVCIIRPADGLDARYLAAYLSSPSMQSEIGAEHYGMTRQALTKQQILNFEIPLPPRAEQTRIADKIDALMSKIRQCRGRLDRVPQIMKRFREAVLEAAVSGRLTEEWRVSTGIPRKETWTAIQLSGVCPPDRIITYGVIKLGAEVAGGVPCLRTSNVRWLHIDEDGMKRISPQLSGEYRRTVLRGDEVLVNVRGTLGGVAAVSRHMIGWNVSREVAVVPVARSLLQPRFLALWIAANSSQRWLTGVQKGVAYTGINIEDLRALPVRVPSPGEQSEIIRRVDELFGLAESVERQYEDAISRVAKLTPSILAKAFRGELIPHDRFDEPAEALLRRIRQGNGNAEVVTKSNTESFEDEARRHARRGGRRG
jgi:type I restriction enzyme S subunit